jgi:hypothetical protein
MRETERDMAALERRRDRLGADLARAAQDRDELARIGTELATVEQDLAEAEARWLVLAEDLERS